MAEKNRVWMRQKDVDDLGQDAGWCNVYSYEPAPPSREVTLVIHDGPSERVWTESEVRAMRWIPVAEQLPEMVPDGIGWSKSEEVLAMYIDADIRYCKVAYCRTTPEGHIQWIGIKATHWMPLPEAP